MTTPRGGPGASPRSSASWWAFLDGHVHGGATMAIAAPHQADLMSGALSEIQLGGLALPVTTLYETVERYLGGEV